jgi:hypothetical protein
MVVGLCPFPWLGSDLARNGIVTCLAFVPASCRWRVSVVLAVQFLSLFLKRCAIFKGINSFNFASTALEKLGRMTSLARNGLVLVAAVASCRLLSLFPC